MSRTTIVFSDGRQLSSGETGKAAIRQFTLTRCVSDGQEVAVGTVCAAMAEIELILPDDSFLIGEGEEFTVLWEDGVTTQVGVFLAEKPLRTGAYGMRLTAYDRISLLDQELAPWLATLDGWPYRLRDFAAMVAQQCGVPFIPEEISEGDYPVEKLSLSSVTGRQLMRWLGEVCGRFCLCDPEGNLRFSWYTPKEITLTPSGEYFYFQGSLSYEDYSVLPVEKVQLRSSGEDIGTVYPNIPEAVNTYIVTGNPLLTGSYGDGLLGVAQGLYEILKDVSYTPCKVKVPAKYGIRAGDILQVSDAGGKVHTVYVMKCRQSGATATLECTGSPSRQSSRAVNDRSYQSLSGKVMELKTTVDGIRAENQDQEGRLSGLSLDVEGITAEVSRQQNQLDRVNSQMTEIRQTAEKLELSVQNSAQQGAGRVVTQTGFTFDENGLTIQKSGTQMENLLNETGMFIKRSGEVILRADQEGVTAVDVTVGNYLMIGEHARLEDYTSGTDTKRTACFWI